VLDIASQRVVLQREPGTIVPIVPEPECSDCHPELYERNIYMLSRLCRNCYDKRFPPCEFCGVHHHKTFGPPLCAEAITGNIKRLRENAPKIAHITERPLGTTPTDLDRFRELFLDAGIFLSEREKDAHTMTVLSITHHVGLRGFACEFFFDSEGAFQVNGVFNDRP
jgi:hypothetical protein